ncbi:MAG: hypothetical protein M3220_02930, partial [Chloroflexota bacterium]|nr:hypothetical protein [Chloroflexota bacterium]
MARNTPDVRDGVLTFHDGRQSLSMPVGGADQLLISKLYMPRVRPNLVPRPRLIARLDAGLSGLLTLLSAPAGFGKTTLLSDWLSHTQRPVAWLSLDERDSDPIHLLRYLVAALRTIVPSFAQATLALLQSPQAVPVESLLTLLLNDLVHLPQSCILVLDDYHVLQQSPIHQAITFLVEHLPPQLHLVITSREDPPLPLSRLRARDQLCELRAADLRFTPSEAAAFLNGTMGLSLTEDDVAMLERRTEGWIAGLQLAALSIREQADRSNLFASLTGSNRYILDYLADEVLSHQPEPVQRFLLHTSILDRLSGPLCDALLEDGPPAQAMLERLEQANLFLVPLDDERRWYRYHDLFATFLRARLHQSQPDLIALLHDRASRWYEQAGFISEAIRHALEAQAFGEAARLLEE